MLSRADIQQQIFDLKTANPDDDNAIIRELVADWLDDFDLSNPVFTQQMAKQRLVDDLDSYQWELPEEEEDQE